MNSKLEHDLMYTRAELAALTREAYYAQTPQSPELRVSLIANIDGGTFRAVGQAWRPQSSTMAYQLEINKQTPHFSR